MKRFPLAAGAVLLMLAVAALASADGYCHRPHAVYAQSYNYVQPTYNYGYQQPYYQPYYQPYAVPFHYSPDYYYSVSDYYRDALLKDAVAGRVADLLKDYMRPPQQPPAQGPPGNVQPITPPTPPAKGGTRTTVAAELVKSIEGNGCLRCHAPGAAAKAGGGAPLDPESLATMPEGARWKLHGLVASGEMPKGGKPVPDGELKLYYDHAKLLSK